VDRLRITNRATLLIKCQATARTPLKSIVNAVAAALFQSGNPLGLGLWMALDTTWTQRGRDWDCFLLALVWLLDHDRFSVRWECLEQLRPDALTAKLRGGRRYIFKRGNSRAPCIH
jgi:hypothetical protein